MREKEKDSQSFCAKLAVMISVLMLILVMIATGSKIVYAADNAKATTNNDSGDTVTSPKKIISVVYDDSGSMAGERWTYANYSLQTLTSLLNTQDELYVTYMSDPSDAKKISLTDIQDSVDKIRDKEDSQYTRRVDRYCSRKTRKYKRNRCNNTILAYYYDRWSNK